MSDSSFMKIQFESLQQAQDDLGTAAAAVQNTIDELESKLQANLSQWSGAAQQAYIPVKQSWRDAIEDMQRVLTKAGGHLATAQQIYADAENHNMSIWNA
ncbi:MAG: WXG100 family type VII secretion target [Streptosporangiaceae bacterium]